MMKKINCLVVSVQYREKNKFRLIRQCIWTKETQIKTDHTFWSKVNSVCVTCMQVCKSLLLPEMSSDRIP